jgi:hypothetical protein
MRKRSKVRKLIESMQVSFLNSAAATVCANDRLLESFDKTFSYLHTFIIATDNIEKRNVASVQGGGNTRKRSYPDEKSKKKTNDGEDRYYKPGEWWALSKEKRDSITAKRKMRKTQTSAASTETTSQEENQVSSVQMSQRR